MPPYLPSISYWFLGCQLWSSCLCDKCFIPNSCGSFLCGARDQMQVFMNARQVLYLVTSPVLCGSVPGWLCRSGSVRAAYCMNTRPLMSHLSSASGQGEVWKWQRAYHSNSMSPSVATSPESCFGVAGSWRHCPAWKRRVIWEAPMGSSSCLTALASA